MAVTTVTGPFVYLPFRHLLWTYTLCIARQFYWSDSHPDVPCQTHSLTAFNRLNRAAVLPTFPVGPGLFIRSAVIAFLTCVLSEVAHIAFTSFFVEDPFPSGKTISDKSSDPNGTLVTGLRSTKAPLTQVSSACPFTRAITYEPISPWLSGSLTSSPHRARTGGAPSLPMWAEARKTCGSRFSPNVCELSTKWRPS